MKLVRKLYHSYIKAISKRIQTSNLPTDILRSWKLHLLNCKGMNCYVPGDLYGHLLPQHRPGCRFDLQFHAGTI